MKYRIKISRTDFDELKKLVLVDHPKESAAFALAGVACLKNITDIIVRRPIAIPKELFVIQEELHLNVSSKAINGLIALCETNQLGAVICHSHPEDIPYSDSDDIGEKRIVDVLRQYIPKNAPTASLVFFPHGVWGRIWVPGATHPVPISEIIVIGESIKIISLDASSEVETFDPELFDRQVPALGEKGQGHIRSVKVGIVGVGGTGSPTAEQLVRLGVQDIVLVDKDIFEKSNLTRVYGTFAGDVPKKQFKWLSSPRKVQLLVRHLKNINPKVALYPICKDIVMPDAARVLLDRDIIFLCTDNLWSRSVVNELSYRYFIPIINMGVRIDARDGAIIGATGVVDVLRPDLPCLWCKGALDADRIAAESLPAGERNSRIREGYVQDAGSLAPSVVSLTTTISGFAVTTFLQLVTGFMGQPGLVERLNYDICSNRVNPGRTKALDKCICKKVRAYGDLK